MSGFRLGCRSSEGDWREKTVTICTIVAPTLPTPPTPPKNSNLRSDPEYFSELIDYGDLSTKQDGNVADSHEGKDEQEWEILL
jgi:hypothetical protein